MELRTRPTAGRRFLRLLLLEHMTWVSPQAPLLQKKLICHTQGLDSGQVMCHETAAAEFGGI